SFHVIVSNVERTQFPAPGRDDVAIEIRDRANLDPSKDAILAFVHPLYVADVAKRKMASCPDAPDDFPAYDEQVVKLQWGYAHPGLRSAFFYVDEVVDECVDINPIEVKR